MNTTEGRYYTGQKTYWFACPEASGRVDDIEVAVKAWDNEGRSFQSPVIKLTPDQVKRATEGTEGHLAVIEELIRAVYETGCAAERLNSLLAQVANGQEEESKPGQDQGNVPDAAVQGSGDPVEGQTAQ